MRPVFPQQQTSLGSVGTSVQCHERTLSTIRVAQTTCHIFGEYQMGEV
jgi:hypothetical protein